LVLDGHDQHIGLFNNLNVKGWTLNMQTWRFEELNYMLITV